MPMRIVVATAASDASYELADQVIRLSRLLSAQLSLLHVVPGYRLVRSRWVAAGSYATTYRHRRQARTMLQQAATYYAQHGVEVDTLVRAGGLERSLCAVAEDQAADLVVVGHRGAGQIGEKIFGSVALRVMRRSGVPLLMVRRGAALLAEEGASDDALRILLPVEDSGASERCVRHLETLAPHLRVPVRVTLLHVFNRNAPDIQRLPRNTRYLALERRRARVGSLLQEVAARLHAVGVGAEICTEEGRAGVAICRVCAEGEHDLVLVGPRRHAEQPEQAQGSVHEYVVNSCATHVWVVP